MTDYGIVLLSYAAKKPEKVAFTARELSHEARLPLPTVSKILKLLCKGELLASSRGVNGGYRLEKAPEEISVARIIEVLEGPIGLTDCAPHVALNCGIEAFCPVMKNWKKISSTVRLALDELSLRDMTQTVPFVAVPLRHRGRP